MRPTASAAAMYFGQLLRMLRKRKGLSAQELGAMVGYSGATVASVECCARIPTRDFITRVDEALQADEVLLAAADHLAHEQYPAFFKDYAAAEIDAKSVFSYDVCVVNGLLQTEDYARAVMTSWHPPRDEEEIAQLVSARLDRQSLLTRKPAAMLSFVIDEAVLRRPVGGRGVLLAQLDHLLACAKQRNLSIQVMPLANGDHAGLTGPLKLIETEDRKSLAYLEVQGHSKLVCDPDEVGVMAQRCGMIRSQALRPEESIGFIEQLTGEL